MSEITGRIVLQQCTSASLTLPNPGETEKPEIIDIGRGVVVFICFLDKASEETVTKLVKHITNVRLSEDETGKRRSILDVQGNILIIPQATLGGRLKGKSMQYHMNVEKTLGEGLYHKLCQEVREAVEEGTSGNVKCGVYGARQVLKMDTNGPFTHIVEV